jgi:hypothetical protein
MKTAFFLILFVLTACDQPATNRRSLSNYTPFESSAVSGTGTATGTSTGTGGSTVDAESATEDSFAQTNNYGAGFESCNLNVYKDNAVIGQVSVCKNSNQETSVKVKYSRQDYAERNCLIPSHKLSNGSSFYLGVPQCMFHATGQILNGQLVKNRSGFTQYAINNIMVMKQTSLNAYFGCMDAVVNHIAAYCPTVTDTSCNLYNANPQMKAYCQQCITNAYNSMNNLCNQFKANHSYLSFDV